MQPTSVTSRSKLWILFLLMTNGYIHVVTSNARSNGRTCKTSGVQISKINPEVIYAKELRHLNDGLKYFLRVTLKTSKIQGIEFDGYLIRLRKSYGHNDTSIVPETHCQNSPGFFWIQTANSSECTWTAILSQCLSNTTSSTSMNYCPCAKHNCLQAVDLPCFDVLDLLNHRHGKFYSLPMNAGFAEFAIEFHQDYILEAYVYYRQYYSGRTSKRLASNATCIDVLSEKLHTRLDKARNECCDLRNVEIDVTITEEIDVTGDEVTLYAIATWTTDLSQYTFDVPLDGYAVRMRTDPSLPNPEQISSDSICISNSSYVWVNTTGDPNCGNTSIDKDRCEIQNPGFCQCPLENCSVIEYGVDRTPACRDITYYFGEGYKTIPTAATKVQYPVQLNQNYQFDILPYSRLYSNKAATSELFEFTANECLEYLKVENTPDIDVARQFCCGVNKEGKDSGKENGAIITSPYGVQQTKVVPIFKQSANETTVNVTITWFPPDINTNASINVILRPFLSDKIMTVKKLVANSSEEFDPRNCSSTPTFFYETVLYDLDPGPSYVVDIHATYDGNTCTNGRCTTTFALNAQVPEDLCQEEFRYCVPEAVCRYTDGIINANCVCTEGYTGDGKTQGSRCEDIDMCNTPDNICSPGAICTDLPPPALGMSCACPDGFYGDGLRAGSGCDSKTTLLLSILLPTLFVLILAAIIAAFLIRKRSQTRKNQQLQRFITDLYAEEGILTYYQDPDAISIKQQTWQPTFGKKWELDRNEIQFENVLGRGNYGIVYKGYLCSEKPLNGGRSNEAGEFYDLVKTNETYGHIDSQSDDGSALVAVKCLQESIHSHENLLNFLAEISFMLNLGEHDNIVKVHGCSTTESPVFMVMEYLCYGNLLHFLWDAREPSKRESDPIYNVTELSLSTMVRDVAQGLVYLQQIRVIHGDIAARNILVGENGTCKLSDFGLSSDVYRYGHIKQGIKEIAIPLKWTSPERMMNGRYPITSKSDVWSYGNLLYEVFTLGCAPYPRVQASDLLEFLKSGSRMEKPNSCSDEMYELMNKCWRWRASSRPSFTQILNNLENIVNTVKSQKQAPAVLAVEDLDKELYEQELKAGSRPTEIGNTNSDRSLPHYENIHAAESEL